MNKKLISIILLTFTILLMFSCRERNIKNKFTPLKMPGVPAIITDPADRKLYIINHFWEAMDFGDTVYLSHKENLENHFRIYMEYLVSTPFQERLKSVNKMIDSVFTGDSLIIEEFRELYETALYDPNSKYRDEELYMPVLEKFIFSGKVDTIIKEVLVYQLEMTKKNRPGTKALDFRYTMKTGITGQLYGINSDYTLLAFIDPDCPACQRGIERLKSSPVLKNMRNKVRIVTMYAGVDHQRWNEWSGVLDSSWVNGYDREMKIQEGSLYDLRPTPSFYLMDNQKNVLLKDAPLEYIERYLKDINHRF
jgi:hypothetical protein